MRFSRVLILLLNGLALLQNAHYAPLLPDPIASHFDGAGQANGWSSKSEFLTSNLLLVVGMTAMFLSVGWLVSKVPAAWVNLPNKDYWLAPKRRAATLDAMGQQMEWLAAATLVLLLGINQLTIQANLQSTTALPAGTFWLLFSSYMVFMIAWLAWFVRKWYAKPPRQELS